jgi:hemerythrin superfamily protein
MNASVVKPSPSIAKIIRTDHTHVLAVFHRYKNDAAPRTKQALVDTVCLALDIHAQLEEEILYPAMSALDSPLVQKSVPEHDEMRLLMANLRTMEPTNPAFDETFLDLMRTVIHHVADEETLLLPELERLLADRLSELGTQMVKRRRQLMLSHAGEMTRNAVRAMPTSTMLVGAGALLAGTYVIRYALKKN